MEVFVQFYQIYAINHFNVNSCFLLYDDINLIHGQVFVMH